MQSIEGTAMGRQVKNKKTYIAYTWVTHRDSGLQSRLEDHENTHANKKPKETKNKKDGEKIT